MFSVDNFYEYLNSYFGFESDGRNILFRFDPHGSKNWQDLRAVLPMESDPNAHTNGYPGTLEFFCSHLGSIILHDQEPFDQSMLDTYRCYMQKEKNSDYDLLLPEQVMLFGGHMRSSAWPIFCHSELGSKDVEFAVRSGAIPCYYFYHGLIARDWFRHWEHHAGIRSVKSPSHRFLLYARDCTGSRQYRARLLQDLLPLRSKILHDWEGTRTVDSSASAHISVRDAQSSCIHLVAETVFDRNKIHLTEKIFKPMVMLQPFIVFAGAGSLAYLRSCGFRTFSDFWDESYDQERDHTARYMKIIDLIHQLATLPDNRMRQILQACQVVVRHNRERFYSKDFEKDLLQELHHNFAVALDEQQRRLDMDPGGGYLQVIKNLLDSGKNLSQHRRDDVGGRLRFIGGIDPERLQNILSRHPWLESLGFV